VRITGLRYVPAYLHSAEHDTLLATVAGLEWHDVSGRRCWRHGFVTTA